ncbi:AAA family ATPase [Actinospongicola halichondriae]|uniref:AAA family ATPase n=1 Tax=Actinospongicola halichondriae TaxID=3236844 RepID=UPI003D4F34C3
MRPVRIEIEGFAAFRERAVVDLADIDLFALVGPTGAGKSTVIDAMVFALYGSVPRYGSKGLVYPVITQGALEARVRLDFTVGHDHYIATRVVRRTKTGATTKEARLERREAEADTTVLAEDADGVTAGAAELLGLELEQFTKCVVLPQGAFATLLHDTKATRQDLLVKLLDLGLYERLATAARSETKRAAQRIEFLDEQLARSAHATPTAVVESTGRVDALAAVVAELDAAAPELARLDDEIRLADESITEANRASAALATVATPPDLHETARQADQATEAVGDAETVERAAADAVAAASIAVEALPDAGVLRSFAADHERMGEIAASIDKGTRLVAEVEESLSVARSRVDEATLAVRDAETLRDQARTADVAADLARHLHLGDDCPVCGSTIDALPSADGGALAAADQRLDVATRALREATTQLADVEKTEVSYRAKLDERIAERDQLSRRLAEAPSPEEIAETLQRIAAAEESLRTARTEDERARADVARCRSAADAAARQMARARADFVTARDNVAAFGPPPVTDDLAADWDALVQWSNEERARRQGSLEDRTRARATAIAARDERRDALGALAETAGVARAPASSIRDRCVAALATERSRHEQLEREVTLATQLGDERALLDERRQVHDLLAEQLGARGFEAWLLDEALDALLAGASTWLELLSSGRYAMAVDDKKQFAVIDHANADERRIARTLSGGETFLASLALALALAEGVSELSATGGNTLDAIFLDEGFGTLDPDTLDVVATAIEELGATGRMVGIISHVADLAERVPVRFEVSKSPGTSTIERVDA